MMIEALSNVDPIVGAITGIGGLLIGIISLLLAARNTSQQRRLDAKIESARIAWEARQKAFEMAVAETAGERDFLRSTLTKIRLLKLSIDQLSASASEIDSDIASQIREAEDDFTRFYAMSSAYCAPDGRKLVHDVKHVFASLRSAIDAYADASLKFDWANVLDHSAKIRAKLASYENTIEERLSELVGEKAQKIFVQLNAPRHKEAR